MADIVIELSRDNILSGSNHRNQILKKSSKISLFCLLPLSDPLFENFWVRP